MVMCPCRVPSHHKCTTLGGIFMVGEGRRYREISVPSIQSSREPKTALKIKSIYIQNN